ncbi:uncharacterized protein LOC126681633 [Mercurialis annua]|uniref:uncharacterized protein LOC126681633 n=1 Tax=Mercurialis annua TaxID=3986 RepID=UPI002160A381|nr:uncharacterized protein LOC126681633 [Mercurialis annua]
MDPSCPFCTFPEDIMHLLFHCPRAKQIWFISPLNFRATWEIFSNFAVLWKHVTIQLQQIDPTNEGLHIFCYTLWHIWKTRNCKIFDNFTQPPASIVSSTVQDYQEFKEAMQSEIEVGRQSHNRRIQSGQNLINPPDFIKINYDAAVHIPKQFGSIGVIAANPTNLQ